MIITILFANEENLSCLEGLIVQPVFQAFLGFLVMATAVVGTPGTWFETDLNRITSDLGYKSDMTLRAIF